MEENNNRKSDRVTEGNVQLKKCKTCDFVLKKKKKKERRKEKKKKKEKGEAGSPASKLKPHLAIC